MEWLIGELVALAGPAYFFLQILTAARYRGRWRVAALVPLVAPVLSHVPPWVDLALPDITQRPPDGTREDVLHVPKSRLASKA